MKWFKHDSRANRDAKIEKLLMKFGSEGYALFWLCLELIADRIESDCISFELEHDSETLASRLKLDTLRVDEIMRWMVLNGLFESNGEKITCMKLAKRLDASIIRSPELLKIQKAMRNADDSPGQSGTVDDSPGLPPIVDERPEQIRLDKNRIEENKERERPAKKSPALTRHKFGKFKNVLLTDDEVQKLAAEYSNHLEAIEFLSEAKEMKGYTYKSDYLALRKWVFDAIKEQKLKTATIENKEKKLAGVETFQPSSLPRFNPKKHKLEAPTEEERAQIDIEELSKIGGGR